MKPQKQIHENGCLQAVVASLLDCDINTVPNFVEAGEDLDDNGYPAWWASLQGWLREKPDMFFLEIHLRENVLWQPLPHSALCILIGTTERGVKHMVIGRVEDDKFLPIFNPHPSAGHLTAVEGLGFLVPRDPKLLTTPKSNENRPDSWQ